VIDDLHNTGFIDNPIAHPPVKLVLELTVGLCLPAQSSEPLIEVGSFAEIVVLPVASPHDSDYEGDAKHRPPHGQLLVAATTREQIQHDLTTLPIIVASRRGKFCLFIQCPTFTVTVNCEMHLSS